MGLALDEVGDILEMTATEGEGITITNRTDVPLPENIEDNVITPVIRKFFAMTGLSAHIDVVVCQKIYPGSGIGSSAASSAAAAYGMNELFDCPLSDEEMVICAMEGENLASGGYHADNAARAASSLSVAMNRWISFSYLSLAISIARWCTRRSWCPRRRRAASFQRKCPCIPPSASGGMWAASSPACIPATSAWSVAR